jgi:hypothetical protein
MEKASNFRFRTVTFVLAIGVLSLFIHICFLIHQVRQINKELESIRIKNGMLPIVSGDYVIVRELMSNFPNTWSFRIYVPLDCEAQLVFFGEKEEVRTVFYRREIRMDISLFRANDSSWYLNVFVGYGDCGTTLSGGPSRNFRWKIAAPPDMSVPPDWVSNTSFIRIGSQHGSVNEHKIGDEIVLVNFQTNEKHVFNLSLRTRKSNWQ